MTLERTQRIATKATTVAHEVAGMGAAKVPASASSSRRRGEPNSPAGPGAAGNPTDGAALPSVTLSNLDRRTLLHFSRAGLGWEPHCRLGLVNQFGVWWTGEGAQTFCRLFEDRDRDRFHERVDQAMHFWQVLTNPNMRGEAAI